MLKINDKLNLPENYNYTVYISPFEQIFKTAFFWNGIKPDKNGIITVSSDNFKPNIDYWVEVSFFFNYYYCWTQTSKTEPFKKKFY